MTVLSSPPPGAVASQDTVHDRIRVLLDLATTALLDEQAELGSFRDRRRERDRPSGASWRGVATMVHVSALLSSARPPAEGRDATRGLIDAVDDAVRRVGMGGLRTSECQGVRQARWTRADGDLLDLVIGVRVGVRAISAPFLPGSLEPLRTTSPPSPISPLTPPVRPLHGSGPR